VLQGKRRRRLFEVVCRASRRGDRQFSVRSQYDRQERVAKLRIRTTRVVLDIVERPMGEQSSLAAHVLYVQVVGTAPRGEEPIHGRLLTNHPLDSEEDVELVLLGYAQRRRIEDLHRTWKSGACHGDETQLRSTKQVVK
jgi:hypothetical protein